MIRRSFRITALLLILVFFTAAAAAGQENIRLALTGFENMDESDEHDYLSAVIRAVLRDDLSDIEGITLLDRARMDEVLTEQQLQISGLFDDSDAVEAGRLLGSDYLTGGGFIVIDTEVLIDVTLISVETGEVSSFSSRGNSEDIIHLAAEKISHKLTGKRSIFRTAESDNPLIKETLLPPGTLKLFSPLIDARIYIDDEFYGYTLGDNRIPQEIELKPGKHTIRTDLGKDFGVVQEPEIIFDNWNAEFEIESDKTIVLEDKTRHFNDFLYRIQKIVQDRKSFPVPGAKPYGDQHDFSFLDRSGKAVEGSITLYFSPTETGGLNAQVMVKYDYDRKVWNLECAQGETVELDKTIGLIDIRVELDSRFINRTSASWSIWRNDVYQGLHREEYY